jgi:chorismate synthase
MGHVRFLTAGESHGKGLTVIVEGIPAGLPIDEKYISIQMSRRQRGFGRGGRMAIEKDFAKIVSGVRHGQTLGSPISMEIKNEDWKNWSDAMDVGVNENPTKTVTRLRPGHADLAGSMKYYQEDVRNTLERSSARETAARVAAGAICRRLLEEFNISFHSHVVSIGGEYSSQASLIDWSKVESSPVRCSDPEAEARMINAIAKAKEDGDTLGGIVQVILDNVPIGLGSHVQWDRRIDGKLAQALMSINAVKGVAIGDGWDGANERGSKVHDVIKKFDKRKKIWTRSTNRAGGTEGGMTNGMPLVVNFALKPISTLSKPLPSIDLITGEKVQAHYERSDVCVVPAAGVVGEAMVGLIVADLFLEKFGGDHVKETRRNLDGYVKTLGPRGI